MSEIADWVHEQGEMLDVDGCKLTDALKHYRASLPPGVLLASRPSKTLSAAARKVTRGLDELAELEALYARQMSRISIDVAAEKSIRKLLPSTVSEIAEARQILGRIAQLKLDLGVHQRQLGKLNIEADVAADVAERYAGTPVAEVVVDPEKRHRVLALARRVLRFASENDGHAETGQGDGGAPGDDDP